MLVLSRRPEEKILLPTVPAVLKVVSSQASLVRIGIEAPAHVAIVREELYRGLPPSSAATAGELTDAAGPAAHGRLNNLILGLTLLRMQLGKCDPAVRKTLDSLEAELEALSGPAVGAAEPSASIAKRERAVRA